MVTVQETASTGSKAQSACACDAGYYGDATSGTCTACSGGFFKASVGNHSCEPCPSQQTSGSDFQSCMENPTGQPTSQPSKTIQMVVKVAMKQAFETAMLAVDFMKEPAYSRAFERVIHSRMGLGSDERVEVTGAIDQASRRRLRSG